MWRGPNRVLVHCCQLANQGAFLQSRSVWNYKLLQRGTRQNDTCVVIGQSLRMRSFRSASIHLNNELGFADEFDYGKNDNVKDKKNTKSPKKKPLNASKSVAKGPLYRHSKTVPVFSSNELPASVLSVKTSAFGVSWLRVTAGYEIIDCQYVELCDQKSFYNFHRNHRTQSLLTLVERLPLERVNLLGASHYRPHNNNTINNVLTEGLLLESTFSTMLYMRCLQAWREEGLNLTPSASGFSTDPYSDFVYKIPQSFTASHFHLLVGGVTVNGHEVVKDILNNTKTHTAKPVILDKDVMDRFYETPKDAMQNMNICLLQALVFYETMISPKRT